MWRAREKLRASPMMVVDHHGVENEVVWDFQLETTQQRHSSREEWSPLSSLSTAELRRLRKHFRVHRLQIQVANQAHSTFPASSLDTSIEERDPRSSAWSSPSGVTVQVDFLPQGNLTATKQHFLDVLDHLVGPERWILAPLRSVNNPRRHYWVDTRSFSSHIDMRVTLPTEAGAALSAEGLLAFLKKYWPCQATSGLASLWTPSEWSSRLLGAESKATNRRRGLWMDLQLCDDEREDEEEHGDCQVALSTGIDWSTSSGRSSSDAESLLWSKLLGTKTIQPALCPVLEESVLQLVPSSTVSLQTQHDSLQWNLSYGIALDEMHFTSTRIPQSTRKGDDDTTTLSEGATGSAAATTPWWQLSTHLERPNGPSYRGRLVTSLENHHASCSAVVQLQQAISRVLIQPIWQSLRVVHQNATTFTTSLHDATSVVSKPNVTWLEDGFVLFSFHTTVPQQSRVQLVLDYEPSFLPSFELFPGDANRGVELPPAQAWVQCGPCISAPLGGINPPFTITPTTATLFSDSLLLIPPLPDMSMPFNVLSLSSTLAAFVVGAVFNMLLKKGREKLKYELHPELRPKSNLAQLKQTLWSRFARNQKAAPEPKSQPLSKEKKE